MKKHLRLCYGADDRFDYVKGTVIVSIDHFDTIRIVNTGPKYFEKKLKEISDSEKLLVNTIEPFYGDLELVKGNYLKDIDENDWFLWLDADERPSQSLLNNLDNIIDECEKLGYVKCRFPWLQHEKENANCTLESYNHICKSFPTTLLEFQNSSGVYAKDVLIKKIKNLSPNSNFGGHGSYTPENDKHTNYKKYIINHYKSNLAKEQSLIYSTWFLSFINVNTNNQKEFINNPCYQSLLKFRKENDVVLQNDMIERLRCNDLEFKEKLKNLLLSDIFKNATDWYSYYYRWASIYNCSVESDTLYCGGKCCKYNNIQL